MKDSLDRFEQPNSPTKIIPAKLLDLRPLPHGKDRFENIARIGTRLFIATTLLTTSAGSLEALTKGGVTRTYSSFADSFTPRPEKPVFPYDKTTEIKESRDSDFFFLLQQNVNNYQNWQQFNETRLKGLLDTRQPKEVWEILQQQDASFLQQGVNILQTAWLMGLNPDQIQISFNQNDLWINDEQYNLKDRFEMQLANANLQTKIKLLENNINNPPEVNSIGPKLINTEPNIQLEETQKLQESLKMLLWLKQHRVNIKIEDEGMAFFNSDEMVKLARMFYGLDLAGIKPKGQITWCNSYDCLVNGGWAAGEADFFLRNNISLKPYAGADVVTHEEGHEEIPNTIKSNFANIGKKALKVLPTETALSTSIIPIPGFNAPEIPVQLFTKDRQTFISDYAMKNDEEDFAETFMNYMMRGDAFRSILRDRKAQNQDISHILQQKYDFMKNEIFRGIEFLDGAIVKKPQNPVSIGQQRAVVEDIQDNLWYPEKPAVCANSVSVIGGPYTEDLNGQTQKVWEIEVKGGQFNFGPEQAVNYKAFVPENALGDEINNNKA